MLAAFDKFKGTISAQDAGQCALDALSAFFSQHDMSIQGEVVPMADGGDGFLPALLDAYSLTRVNVTARGPLGLDIQSHYGISADRSVAVIEMAEVSGLHLVPMHQRNPLNTTTYGFGQLIRHAVEHYNVKSVLLGLGGSATCDGGLGALQALGVVFTMKKQGEENSVESSSEILKGKDVCNVISARLPSPPHHENCCRCR